MLRVPRAYTYMRTQLSGACDDNNTRQHQTDFIKNEPHTERN